MAHLRPNFFVGKIDRRIFAAWSAAVAFASPLPAFNAGEVKGLSSGPVPDWVETQTWSLPGKPAPQGTPAAIVLSDSQDRLSPEESAYFYHTAVRLLNAEGVRQNAEPSAVYSPEYQQVTWHTLRLIRGEQVIDLLPKVNFRQLQRELGFEAKVYDGQITAAAVLEDVRVGDILEQAYTLHDMNPLMAGNLSSRHYFGAGYPIERQSLIVRMPATGKPLRRYDWIPPGTKALPDAIFRPAELFAAGSESVSGPEKVFRWRTRGVPAIQFDRDISPQAAPYYPMVRLSSFHTWRDVAEWARALFATSGELPEAIKVQAAAWREKLPDAERRLRAAVDWVQGEVRYFAMAMGEHNLKPRSLEEICATRFGDCKDKTVLLVEILRALGFKAWPMLVNSYSQEKLMGDGPDQYAFNHVIVAYEYEGVMHWVDPTLKQPAGASAQWALPPYRLGLLLREGEIRLTLIPGDKSDEPDTVTHDQFVVKADTGDAILNTTVTLRGLEADFYRMRMDGMSAAENSKRWFNYISQFYRRLQEEAPPEITDDRATNAITIRAKYRLPEFRRREGERVGFTVYAYAIRTLLSTPESRRRHWPYGLPAQRHIRHEIEVDLPDQPPVDQRPQMIAHSGMTYESAKGLARGRLRTSHDLKFTEEYVPAANMEAYADSADEVLADLSTTIFSAPQPAPAKKL